MNLLILIAIITGIGMIGCFGFYYWSRNTYTNYEDGLTIAGISIGILTIILIILIPIIVICQPKKNHFNQNIIPNS